MWNVYVPFEELCESGSFFIYTIYHIELFQSAPELKIVFKPCFIMVRNNHKDEVFRIQVFICNPGNIISGYIIYVYGVIIDIADSKAVKFHSNKKVGYAAARLYSHRKASG